eukprot:SAG31_NODE_4555_length_3143_cov_5.394875_6_plen_142_part_00
MKTHLLRHLYVVAVCFVELPAKKPPSNPSNIPKGAKGTADKAMRTIRPGGTILVLPGGNGGTTSRHPKAGVRQMSGGMASATNHTLLDTLASLFDNGQLKPEIFAEYSLHEAAKAFALSKTGTVVGKVAVVAHNDTGVAAA